MMQTTALTLRFDHLPPSEQARFLLDEDLLRDAVQKIRKATQSQAVLLLCTCDRIELWCEQSHCTIVEPLLRSLSLPILTWAKQTVSIPPSQFLEHAFRLAAGLESPLFGEDQIISQLQQALKRSRLAGCSSSQMEYVVRQAITCAKHIQSTIDLQVPDETVAQAVYHLLLSRACKRVLVIGSSAQARLVSHYLSEKGLEVTMTFRDMEKADFLLPRRVIPLAYEMRFSLFDSIDVVVSATKGMGYTVHKEDAVGPRLFIDLAPVRDIDPRIAELKDVQLVTLGDLHVPLVKRTEATALALSLINAAMQEVRRYLSYRPLVEDIQELSSQGANELVFRLNEQLKKLGPEGDDLRSVLFETARKAFSHQLYTAKRRQVEPVYIDLTRMMESGMSCYCKDPEVLLQPYHTVEQEGWRLTKLSFGSHTSTHMDSPFHLETDGKMLEEFPLSRFFAKAVVLDCRGMESVAKADLPPVGIGCTAILFLTDNEQTSLEMKAAQDLLDQGYLLFGFNRPNCDREGDRGLPLHHLLFSRDALILENLTNLEKIAGKVVQLTCLPLLYRFGDGAPTRVVAGVLA